MLRRSLLIFAGILLGGLSLACDADSEGGGPGAEATASEQSPGPSGTPTGPISRTRAGGGAEWSRQSNLWHGPAGAGGQVGGNRPPGTNLDSSGGTGPGFRPSSDTPAGATRSSAPFPW